MGKSNGYAAICLTTLLLLLLPAYASGFATGQVIDALTQKPISGAFVTMDNDIVQTDENGRFTLRGMGNKIAVRACGYLRAEQPVISSLVTAPVEIMLRPFTPKALYLTFYGIGDRTLREAALNLIDQTELNALVIDVKGDRGVITYRSEIPLATEIGAQKLVIVKDIKGLLASLKARGIYTIARIVVFKDDVLGSAKNELAIRTQDGRIWRDKENLIWVDPSKREVWEYNINIAVEAARNGFDEIQFDYVRFPDSKGLKFSVPNDEENRVKNISGFLMEARRRLAPYNVFMAADVFGYASWNLNDTQIGQRLDRIVPYVDYISLMLYPSGFQFGIPGYRNPVEHPYEIVYLSLKKSRERTQISSVRFRPWLQAFRDYAFDKRHFNGPEIQRQIKAAEEFGSDGWMLWNPRNVYTADGLKRQPSLSWKRARPHGSG
ncbi:MAG: GTP-binding protein [Nitrospirae bacterium]|nr:GTP-binding protein [Nitrospirota bacterium]